MHGGSKPIGTVDDDLTRAIASALRASRKSAVAGAFHYSWKACTERFVSGLAADDAEPLNQAA